MRKLLSIIFAICTLGIGSVFTSCSEKELQMDMEYVYTDISFKKTDGLTLDDIAEFVPVFPTVIGAPPTIGTVEEFEKYLQENIDIYYLYKSVENGMERIYIKPSIRSVRITEGYPYIANAYSFWLKTEDSDEELRYGAVRENNVFTFPDSESTLSDFYYSNGALHCELEFNEKFAVVYNYKTK